MQKLLKLTTTLLADNFLKHFKTSGFTIGNVVPFKIAQSSRNLVFPQEVIERILSYVDGKTLLACQKVSPKFAAAVLYLTTKNIWKKCCYNEISNSTIFQIMSKLYPHTEGFNHPKDWRLIYDSWCLLNRITVVTNWQVTALKFANKYIKVCDVYTHGNLILVLLNYNKNFSRYYKIRTINDMNIDLDKSCRFNANSLYITPVEDSKVSDDAVLLYCEICKLIGIPVTSCPEKKNYPKIRCNSDSVSVEHYNGDLLCFYNMKGFLGRSSCMSAITEFSPSKETTFIETSLEYSHLHISFDDVFREFYPFQFFHAHVTSTKSCAGLILLGTETGTLYGYFCKNKMDVLCLDLEKFIWRFDVCADPLLAIDFMVVENRFGIVCNSDKYVYILSTTG